MASVPIKQRIQSLKGSLERGKGPHVAVSVPNLKAAVRYAERALRLEEEVDELKAKVKELKGKLKDRDAFVNSALANARVMDKQLQNIKKGVHPNAVFEADDNSVGNQEGSL